MIGSLREWLYQGGLIKPVELPGFVLSVGNLSLGGTGKSPFVMLLASWAVERGISTGVLTRGYKRKHKNLEVVAPLAPLPEVGRLGDEPWMIKHRVPGISLLVHADRARMAKRHWAEFGSPKLVVLDDGFQHWRAVRDRDVIMLDATESLHQGTFPFGRLRENAGALARADLVVINRAAEVSAADLAALVAEVRTLARKGPAPVWKRGQASLARVVCAQYEFDEFFTLEKGEKAARPAGNRLVLAAGVAKPDGVRAMARTLELPVEEEIYFPDHHRLTSGEIQNIRAAVESRGKEGALLLTEKDWARWRTQLAGIPGFGLRVRFRFLGDGEEVIADFLQEVASCIT